jgi:type 2 lantibiotic biosynthesis protein LanM
MGWTADDRRRLALGGASIDERLLLARATDVTVDTALADTRWKVWLESATSGDPAAFARALADEGIDEAHARRAIGITEWPAQVPLPAWVDDAAWLVDAVTGPLAPPAPDDGPPLAFEPIVRAMAEAIVRRVEVRAGADAWTPRARVMVRRRLAADLAELCGPALLAAFIETRSLAPPADGPAPTGQLDAFVTRLRAGELWRFFDERPVLARVAGQTAGAAATALIEMLERLERDRPAIARELRSGGALTSLEIGLSDRHDGRTVAVLGFESGPRIVYKPRDCHIDLAWRALTRWLAEREPEAAIHAPAVVARSGYGWVEFVTHASCADAGGVARGYRRYGVLVALAWLLASRDLHVDNVIAAGEHPVPIDLETLLNPDVAGFMGSESGDGARRVTDATRRTLERATTASLLLPTEAAAMQDRMFAVGALTPPRPERWERFEWEAINTDRMRRVRRTGEEVRATPSLPALAGERAAPQAHVADIVAGFENTAGAMLRHRDELLAPTGVLAAFAPAEIRVVLRATQFYMLLLQRSRTIAHLSDGVSWSRHFYYQWRRPLTRAAHVRLRIAERAALARGDVPRFVTRADATAIAFEGTTVPAFARSAFDEAVDRIATLAPDAIAREATRIRTAFGVDERPARCPARDEPPAVRRRRTLGAIAETIAARAIERDGGAAWITHSPVVAHGSSSGCGVAGDDLYNGAAGIALFLATLGQERASALALAAVAPVRHDIAERAPLVARTLGLGGASGTGSVVYALTRIAALLDDRALLDDARRLAAAVSPDLVGADRSYDVIGGSAGLILGLLPLYRATRDTAVLALAERAGDHLLAHRTAARGFQVWASGRDPALTGASHGAAGIALALARLGAATGAARFAEAAHQALAFERACYSAEHGGWPDYRKTPPAYPHQWCHGSTGIGLTRVALRRDLDDPAIADEIAAAVASTLAAPPSVLDHYCCGGLGRIELLLSAGHRAEAEQRLDAMLAEADARGRFRWPHGPDDENLGLFQGLAGVGYQILRMERPEGVPSLLVWDA